MNPRQHGKVGFIIMDLWDHDWHNQGHNQTYGTFLDHLFETIDKYNPDSIVFANSFVRPDMQTKDVVNYLREFYHKGNHEQKIKALDDLIEATGTEPLHKKLLHLLNTRNDCIYIPTTSAFEQWTQITGIRSWILVGAHWPICTHDKPLGFNNLKKIKSLHLYSIPSCTLKWLDPKERIVSVIDLYNYLRDSLRWEEIDEDLYKLLV